jgi:hypothetical protein
VLYTGKITWNDIVVSIWEANQVPSAAAQCVDLPSHFYVFSGYLPYCLMPFYFFGVRAAAFGAGVLYMGLAADQATLCRGLKSPSRLMETRMIFSNGVNV